MILKYSDYYSFLVVPLNFKYLALRIDIALVDRNHFDHIVNYYSLVL